MRKTVLVLLALSIVTILTTGIIPARNSSTPVPIVSASPTGSTDYPWTMFHYDAVRAGATPAAGPASATPMWTFTTGNIVYPSPVVVDGYVFITSYDGTLYALDQYTGSLLWSFPTSGNIIGTPAVYQGMVFLSSKNGYVYALNEQTGALVWEIANDNLTPVTSSPVIADGLLFYGTFEAPSAGFSELLAVNPQDGTVVWKYDIPSEYVEGSPSVSNGRVFVGAGVPNPAIVLALNDTTGKLLWSYNTANATSISTAPVIAYGRVFVGLDSFRFFALDENTGSLDWSFNTPGGSNATTPALYNGAVYFGTGAHIVYAMNATTGAQIWTRTTGGPVTSSPTVAIGSNELFVGSNDRYLYALSLSTGAVLWRYLAGGQVSSSPAIANGRVYFGAKDHKVYALGATAPRLHDSISSNSTTLQSGQVAAMSIRVTNGTFPITGASVTLTSSQGGTFSSIVDLGSGNYAANYTAPTVGSRVDTTIQVTASYPGYLSATNQTVVTLNPLPTLTVTVSPKPSATTPGGDVLLMIRVTNSSLLITGATLSFSSSGGGSFSSILDSGNGNYTAVFSTPLQSSVPVVTVQATKAGFTSGQGQTTVQVNGVPNLTTLKVAGVPFFLVVATSVVLFLLMLAVIVQKKKKSNSQPGLPPEPSFTY